MAHNSIRRTLINGVLDTWAPTYPRKVNKLQQDAQNRDNIIDRLLTAEGAQRNEPFVSVYSFPDGHTKDDAVPRIDTLFIDFDFEGGDYTPGSGNVDAWRRDLSHLLVRARMVAEEILELETDHWRAALSGHKGIHLFHDFEALDRTLGSREQYIAGINEYANDLIEKLADETGLSSLHDYVDVTSSDLARLCRVPNTIHGGATASFNEARFCVPVSIEELASLSVDEYESLTQAPRASPYNTRHPNAEAADVIENYVETATASIEHDISGSSDIDYSRVNEYREKSNDDITPSDIPFVTSDRPCVWTFFERPDKWDYGTQSHIMELYVIRELIEKRVPIDVIKRAFKTMPGDYDENYTESRIEEIIARNYQRFRTDTILQRAPEFSGYDDCARCQKILDQEETTYA